MKLKLFGLMLFVCSVLTSVLTWRLTHDTAQFSTRMMRESLDAQISLFKSSMEKEMARMDQVGESITQTTSLDWNRYEGAYIFFPLDRGVDGSWHPRSLTFKPGFEKSIDGRTIGDIFQNWQPSAQYNLYVRSLANGNNVYIFVRIAGANAFGLISDGKNWLQSMDRVRSSIWRWTLVSDDGRSIVSQDPAYIGASLRSQPFFELQKNSGQGFVDAKGLGEAFPNSNLWIWIETVNTPSLRTIWMEAGILGVGIFFVCLALVLWIVSSESIYMHQLQLTLKSRDLQISQLMKSQQTHVDSSTKTDQSLATLHEGIERVSSALAHFVKGPAISILGSIQSLLLGEGKGAKVEKENILNQARSLNEISDQLLAFCGEKDESPVKTSISRLLRDYANEETAQLKKRNIKLNIHIPDIADFELRERQILAAIRAVWNNAIESMDKMANKEISLGLVDEGEFVKIILSDTGPGMDSETLQKCLNPFFTTKGKNHFGMGLSLAQGILQQQGGRLQVQSEKGQGTKVTMSIAKLIKQQVKSAQDSQSEPKTKSEVTPILLDMESTMLLGRLPPAPPSKISFENQFEDLKLTATPLTQSPDSPPDINVDVLLDELPEPAPHSVAPEKTSTIAMKDVAVDQPRSGKNIESPLRVREPRDSAVDNYKVTVRPPRRNLSSEDGETNA